MRKKIQGTVKWFDPRKGFGFIESDQSEEDVFVHYLEIQTDGFILLNEGQKVEFSLITRDRGFAAEDVVPLDGIPSGSEAPAIVESEPTPELSPN